MQASIIQGGGDLSSLRAATERASHAVVNCRFCSSCCESGLVYVLPEEKTKLEALGVPIVTFDGIDFIQRAEGGSCPMLGKAHKHCTIYEDRPICCRLYPLDLFSRAGTLEWGLYEYCPVERKREAVLVLNNMGRMDHGLILQALRMLEDVFGSDRIAYLAKEDLVASKLELLDSHRKEYSIVGCVSYKSSGWSVPPNP